MGHDTISRYIEQLKDLDLLDEIGDCLILKVKGLIIDQPKDKQVKKLIAMFDHMIEFNEGNNKPLSRECMIYKKYKENGFKNVKTTPPTGDHGIDIFAEKNEITYAIQCKCYSSNVGNSSVQQAYSGKCFYKKDIGVVLTNQFFTEQAKKEATELGIKLWDKNKLDTLIKNANV